MVLRMVNRVRLTWIILTVREVLSASLSTTRSACLHVEGKQNSSFSTYTYALAAPPKCSKDVPVCRVSLDPANKTKSLPSSPKLHFQHADERAGASGVDSIDGFPS